MNCELHGDTCHHPRCADDVRARKPTPRPYIMPERLEAWSVHIADHVQQWHADLLVADDGRMPCGCMFGCCSCRE